MVVPVAAALTFRCQILRSNQLARKACNCKKCHVYSLNTLTTAQYPHFAA